MVSVVNKTQVQQFIQQNKQGVSNFLLDVRNPSELYDKPKLPTAVNIPLAYVEQEFNLSADDFKKKYGVAKPNSDAPIVTYCAAGMRAQTAASALQKLGYKSVGVYKGSAYDWYSD